MIDTIHRLAPELNRKSEVACGRRIEAERSRLGGGVRHRDHSRADRRHDQGETFAIEHEALAGAERDVARIVRLRDPDRAFAASDEESKAAADVEQVARTEVNDKLGARGFGGNV
jgi:hypothetical protein